MELLIFRSEDYRNSIYSSLQCIVNAYPESPTDISDLSIAIDRGKQPEAVYYQAIRLTDILFIRTSVTHIRALQLTDYLHQMIFIDNVRSNYQFHLRMLIEIFNKQVLIGLPGTSGDKSHRIILEQLNQRQVLSLLPDLKHAVEPGVAHYRHPVDANLGQVTFGTFILHKQMVKVTQHVSVRTAIPFKEYLSATEDGRHTVNRNTALMQLIQIVLPKLIFDEERHAGVHQIKELLHIARLVERQVTHNIRPPVVFAYFVARRRKECQQNTIIRIFGTNLLNQRTPLFKLAQGSRMEPNVACILLQLLPEQLIHHPVPFHHLSWLTAERGSQMHRNIVDYYR